jgi:predicted GIY-YIG superfamily endonuclease
MGFLSFGKKKKVTYKLVKDGKATYIGTTNNPKRRNVEHSASGKKYDYLKVTSPRVSKTEAERRESRNIKSYKKATGKNPKYNKTSDGKFRKRY